MYELALRYERPGNDRPSRRRRPIHVADRPEHARESAGQESGRLAALDAVSADPALRSRHAIDEPAGGRLSARREGDGVGREVGRARGGDRQLTGARPAVLRRQQAASHGERRRRHSASRRTSACASAWRWRAGDYAAEQEVRDKSRGDRRATLAQVEGEWAFRYTRIAGEFLWTERELATADSTRERRMDRDHADGPPASVPGDAL